MNNCNCEAVSNRIDVIAAQAAAEIAALDTRIQLLEGKLLSVDNAIEARILSTMRRVSHTGTL